MPDRKVTGLDIGTGASAIYPLLGCAQRRSWSFIATDINESSLEYARKNVELNDLGSRIRIVDRLPEDRLVPLEDLDIESIDFVMTNPPFYSSESELLELARKKSKPPNSACTGASNEMVCDRGELGFFRRIFEDSLVLKERVQWYTTMVGKLSSLDAITERLQEHEIGNYAVTEFVQGNRTRRWAVGWSFSSRRPCNKASRGFEPSGGKKLLPRPTEITVASKVTRKGGGEQLENVFWTQLEDVTDGLDLLSWNLDEDRLRVVGFVDQNVWSRSYRRSKARGDTRGKTPGTSDGKDGKDETAISDCAFGFSIFITTQKDQPEGKDTVLVTLRWLQGTDYAMFESFSGMLRNALLNVVS
jgi:23S rRNA (adenine1618-N6)-methyltransferase